MMKHNLRGEASRVALTFLHDSLDAIYCDGR